jgi:hypothetical protein
MGCKNNIPRGSLMKKNPHVKLFYTENHKNSEVAIDLLKTKKICFSAIDVEKNNLDYKLERDIGTVQIPTVVSSSGTYIGLDRIIAYVRKK